MADREGRKAELERKKARLLAMRAEKNKKEVCQRSLKFFHFCKFKREAFINVSFLWLWEFT